MGQHPKKYIYLLHMGVFDNQFITICMWMWQTRPPRTWTWKQWTRSGGCSHNVHVSTAYILWEMQYRCCWKIHSYLSQFRSMQYSALVTFSASLLDKKKIQNSSMFLVLTHVPGARQWSVHVSYIYYVSYMFIKRLEIT